MVPNRFAQVGLFGLLLLLMLLSIACGSSASSDGSAPGPSSRTERYCPGAPVATQRILGCPAPARVRPGYTCTVSTTCPSPNGLFGDCQCIGVSTTETGRWRCETVSAPQGYDPYPDCPDEGAEDGSACYLEGSRCIPVAASACFTRDVPLCTCQSHAWKC
jgi:hypothetical protein